MTVSDGDLTVSNGDEVSWERFNPRKAITGNKDENNTISHSICHKLNFNIQILIIRKDKLCYSFYILNSLVSYAT